jgi:hypothetical protein
LSDFLIYFKNLIRIDYRDLSQAHSAVADGLWFDDSVSLINHSNVIIQEGIILKVMEVMKIWLVEYAMFYYRPFMVKHSDENKCYVITYRCGCPLTVHAKKEKDNSWRIASVVQPYTCLMNADDRKHTQLSSRCISQRFVNIIKNYPLVTVATLINVVMVAWGYRVKYGMTWRAKQCALKLIYADWFEAYACLPTMLHAMKAENTVLHFKYVPKTNAMGPEGRQYFFRAFWTIGQCVEAFKHSFNVLSIDSMFLRRSMKVQCSLQLGSNANRQLVSLAFDIMEKKNNGNWG